MTHPELRFFIEEKYKLHEQNNGQQILLIPIATNIHVFSLLRSFVNRILYTVITMFLILMLCHLAIITKGKINLLRILAMYDI